MAVIKWNDSEYYTIIKKILKSISKDRIMYNLIRSRLDRAYITIMEYIPGIVLYGMGQ